MPPRGATSLCGLLAIDKPAGVTSHDVVARVRALTGERRVGHGGTLDPFATGLLVIAVGPATRLARFFLTGVKSYEAVFTFGSETDTGDVDGAATRTAEPPARACDPEFARACIEELVGSHRQVPPAFSAIKIGGRKAYEAARAGEVVDLEPRNVEVVAATLVAVEAESWRMVLTVSKGTYVRALARDLGRELGSAAHVSELRRISSGTVSLEHAITLDQLAVAADQGRVEQAFLRAADVLSMPVCQLDVDQARYVANGRSLPRPATCPQRGPVALVSEGRLLAVYASVSEELRPEVVLPGGCS